jgi:ligand-binding sensor domain-containing protein
MSFPFFPTGWLAACLMLLAITCPGQLLPVRNYTVKEGLNSNSIYAVLRDSRGILWVGTNNGVSYYDGARFFQPPMTTRTGQIYVTNFYEDHEHNIWVTSWYNGLYKYKDGKFVNYLPDSLRLEAQANNTFDMVEWSPGRYIIATDKNVWLFDDALPTASQPRFQLLDSLNHSLDQQIGTVLLAPSGELLIGYGKGIAHYHLNGLGTEKKWTNAGMLWQGSYINRIAILEDQVWLGSDLGLYYSPHLSGLLRDSSYSRPILLYPNVEVDRVSLDHEKNIWFTGGGGVHKILRSGAIRTYSRGNGLPSDAVRAFYSDAEGMTWIGTDDGLTRLGQEYYRFYSMQEKFLDALAHNEPAIIISIHDDKQGNLWMGSYNGLYQAKKDHPKTAPMRELTNIGGKKIGFVNCMIHDNQGRLWACTDGGILLLEGDDPLIKDTLVARCAFVDPDGTMWFGTNKGRIAYCQKGQFHLLPFISTNDERIDGIYHDPKGFLWLGYALTGIRKFRIRGDSLQHILEYTERTGYPNLRTRSLTSDGRGHLLIGTRTDGLYIFSTDGDSLTRPIHITTAEGLAGNWIKASLITPDGCYLVTSNGLDFLKPGPAKDYRQMRIEPIPFRNEQVPIELNALFLQSDTIWLGTPKGLLQYVLHQQGKNTTAPPVCFMNLTINGRFDSSFLPFTQTGTLPTMDYEQNNLAFDFAGLSFRDEDKVSYRYKMEGLDKEWSVPTSRRYVNYSHLAPGSYKLQVVACNDDGLWSRIPATLSFRINAPFWMQAWFIALCIIIAATLVYLLYRYRLDQVIKIERIRAKISTDLHDDIGSTLSSISIMSDMILHTPAEAPSEGTSVPRQEPSPQPSLPDWQRMAGEIKDNSLSLMDKMDDIVWSINPRNDEMENLMVRIQRFAAPLLEARGIDYEIVIEDNIRHLKLSMEYRQHIYLIMKEAVNNLVKYSNATNAVIRARSASALLKVEISDDGSGFDPAKSRKGNGIVNMKSRADLMHADLTIDSTNGTGTSVMLMLKIS